ncbi:MAG: hypothetical protein HS123_23660 [Solibacteraceae bacterium]|nr:hypothetical protein [Solibacteraceae bacterium]
MSYTSVESPYIRARLVATSWKDHELIDDLMVLHRSIGRRHGVCRGMAFSMLQTKRREDFLALLEEHSPTALADFLARETERRLEAERQEVERRGRELARREEWLLAGGRP